MNYNTDQGELALYAYAVTPADDHNPDVKVRTDYRVKTAAENIVAEELGE